MSAVVEERRSASTALYLGKSAGVAELQGLYGPFTFPEKLLQKIWLQGEFDRSCCATLDGRKVEILDAGRWNLLGGPDFKSARIRFAEGDELVGDIEIHLHAGDWKVHGHANDPAYDQVILHVVLFPPVTGHVTVGAHARNIPVVVLLPLLLHDLEEYAAEQAVEALANRPASQIVEKLGSLSVDELSELLADHARERWRQKVRFARLRVERLGWESACHQTALEILGYRFNRAPMLRIATAFPLGRWSAEGFAPSEVFATERGRWMVQGLRPANFPQVRLQQYFEWTNRRREWPSILAALRSQLPETTDGVATRLVRRKYSLTKLRGNWAAQICGGALSGTRFDNLVCDGFLPLIAVQGGKEASAMSLWYHWFGGDLPPIIPKTLRQLHIFGCGKPVCHGSAQGLLGWLIACEQKALVCAIPRNGAKKERLDSSMPSARAN